MPEFSAKVYRFAGMRQTVAHFGGYPVVSVVTVERTLVLRAGSKEQLRQMVEMVKVDGWSANGK